MTPLSTELPKIQASTLSKQDVAALLDATFETIGKAVRTERRFAYPGFGAFGLRQRAAQQGRNPQTGAALKIKASTTVAFKPVASFKSSL